MKIVGMQQGDLDGFAMGRMREKKRD